MDANDISIKIQDKQKYACHMQSVSLALCQPP